MTRGNDLEIDFSRSDSSLMDSGLACSRLTDLFDALSVGAMLVSSHGKIAALNKTGERITGLKAGDVIGRDCIDFFSDDRFCPACRISQPSRDGFRITRSVPEESGLTRIVSPVFDPEKKIAGFLELFQDNSALKDLIERVRHEDRRVKMILDSLEIGVMTVDRGGHVTFFNTSAESITGYRREEILGKSCALLYGKDAAGELATLKETIADGRARSSGEGEIVTKQGQAVPARIRYLALKNEEGRAVGGLGTISDLSLLYQLDKVVRDRYTFYDMVGKDPTMQKIFEIVPVVSGTDATVLIEGPTGTGKDLMARIIHNASPRSGKPMVKVNCAALPDNLLESEMFGYVRGAFTGADRDKPGRFQEADGGTIFLDEIGDLPLSLQAKLLRVLEDREFYPLGSRRTSKVDVRIISATNQGLDRLVKEKRFRGDLFYRLNVMRIELPPLKARRADIPILITHILKRLAAIRKTPVSRISEEAMEILLNHDYPGNIRELENILEHALILCRAQVIERKHLPLSLQKDAGEEAPPEEETADGEEDIGEKRMLLTALKRCGWDRGKSARALNMHRTTLWRKMRKYGLLSFRPDT